METFIATPKKWGNSMGITLPAHIVKKHHITTNKPLVLMLTKDEPTPQELTFGMIKNNKQSLQKIMELIDEGEDHG